MSERTLEVSLTTLAALVLIFIIASIILPMLGMVFIPVGWAVLIGLVVLIFGGGALLYFWGKDYMSR